jgi:3-oxoadipate enol-lactonase
MGRTQESIMNYVETNGVGLRYELSGTGERTLVLVHEMGGTLESWDEVVPHFTPSRRVLRYDTRGAGMSQKIRGELHIDTMADDIASLLDTLGIKGKVALAGVAVGGAIALHFAARYPQRTSAVVVGSPATGVTADLRPGLLERAAKMEVEGLSKLVDDSMLTGYAPELRTDAARFATFRARWLGSDPSSYAAIYRMLVNNEMDQELRTLACPVLVIGGTLDRVRPPAAAEAVAKLIPGSRFVELPTGHYMAAATPELIADTIGNFLKSVDA